MLVIFIMLSMLHLLGTSSATSGTISSFAVFKLEPSATRRDLSSSGSGIACVDCGDNVCGNNDPGPCEDCGGSGIACVEGQTCNGDGCVASTGTSGIPSPAPTTENPTPYPLTAFPSSSTTTGFPTITNPTSFPTNPTSFPTITNPTSFPTITSNECVDRSRSVQEWFRQNREQEVPSCSVAIATRPKLCNTDGGKTYCTCSCGLCQPESGVSCRDKEAVSP